MEYAEDTGVWSGAETEATKRLDQVARQRHAAALAQQELTPEAIKAEEERQRLYAGGVALEPSPPLPVDDNGEFVEPSLGEKLQAAIQPVLDETGEVVPDLVADGRAVVQWALATSEDVDNADGFQLALQVQVDDQPPAGVVAEITQEMLNRWRAGAGLQGNRIEHRKFAAGLMEQSLVLVVQETTGLLIHSLERLMYENPTETAVGDDELPEEGWDPLISESPFADAPENADEVPEG